MTLITPRAFPISEPGAYDMPAERYHADPCVEPSLSNSIAQVLLDASPRHAWLAHPRLNPAFEREESARLDLGTVAHTLLLGKGRDLVEVDADAWTTKAAKERRDAARAAGRTPILTKDADRARAMERAAREQLALIEGAERAFHPLDGLAETVLVWRDIAGPWCRTMIDWTSTDETVVWDYKTTSASAHPAGLGRRIADMGYEVQAAFIERGSIQINPAFAGRLAFRFVFQEIDPPYLLSVVELDAAGLEIGRKKVAWAMETWRRCLSTGNWPGYPARIATVEYPVFAEQQWLAREQREMEERTLGMDPLLMLAPWRPPEPEKPVPTLIGG